MVQNPNNLLILYHQNKLRMKKVLGIRWWVLGVGCWLTVASAFAQTPSALNKKEFAKHWVVESEAADYRVTFRGDTADIVSSK